MEILFARSRRGEKWSSVSVKIFDCRSYSERKDDTLQHLVTWRHTLLALTAAYSERRDDTLQHLVTWRHTVLALTAAHSERRDDTQHLVTWRHTVLALTAADSEQRDDTQHLGHLTAHCTGTAKNQAELIEVWRFLTMVWHTFLPSFLLLHASSRCY
jgi:hypothetical protein